VWSSRAIVPGNIWRGELMIKALKIIAGLAVAVATLLPASTASADTGTADTTAAPAVSVQDALATLRTKSADVSAQALTKCAIKRHNHTGYRICEMSWDYYDWGRGNVETFVVGTNFQIYHIWKGASGWKSLGGKALAAAGNGVGVFTSPRFGVVTIGTDGNGWCRYRGNGNWAGGWKRCG
jgi:hypothetical protein